jgi:SARP family transcriptional regulator, regulator of embCAB operon
MSELTEMTTPSVDTALLGRLPRVSMLGGFQVFAGDTPISLSTGSQRLIAVLALRGRISTRVRVAGTLWPEASDERAFACLRSSLARLLSAERGLLIVSSSQLGLAGDVRVDLDEYRLLARRLVDGAQPTRPDDTAATVVDVLSKELLPGWYDDWVLFECEGWRQLRLHALEALADRLVVEHRCGQAVVAALAAVSVDPLRESARAVLIRVHLAEHNRSEAVREFDRYRQLLRRELDVEPTPDLQALLQETRGVTPS